MESYDTACSLLVIYPENAAIELLLIKGKNSVLSSYEKIRLNFCMVQSNVNETLTAL